MAGRLPELPAAYVFTLCDEVADLRAHACALAASGAEEGTLLQAVSQSSARGLNDKPWHCNEGDLHCAIILRPDFPSEQFGQIYPVAVVSLGNALATHLSPMIALGYLWPNDIVIARHKVAAVWLDCSADDDDPWLCVTASVNIHNSPDDFSIAAMSISEAEGGTDLGSGLLLQSFARQFITNLNHWNDNGMEGIMRMWKIRGEGVGEPWEPGAGSGRSSGKLVELDDSGTMTLQEEAGSLQQIGLAEFLEVR